MDKKYIYAIVPIFDTDIGERGIEIEYTSDEYLGIELPYETALKIAKECLAGETIKKIELHYLEGIKLEKCSTSTFHPITKLIEQGQEEAQYSCIIYTPR